MDGRQYLQTILSDGKLIFKIYKGLRQLNRKKYNLIEKLEKGLEQIFHQRMIQRMIQKCVKRY